jgi:HprK-related kinase B
MAGDLEALVVLNWAGDGAARAQEIDLAKRPELLPAITKSPGLFYEPESDDDVDLSPQRYVETLSLRPVIEITGRRDFGAAERLCLEVLGGAAGGDEGRAAGADRDGRSRYSRGNAVG